MRNAKLQGIDRQMAGSSFGILCSRFSIVFLLLAVAACGGGGGGAESGGPPPPATARTLAYVVSECHEDAHRRSIRQELRIREGAHARVTVAATDTVVQEPPVLPGLCRLFGTFRVGTASLYAGTFLRLGVSPDGSGIVFEKTTRSSLLRLPALAAEEEGFFFVRADGSGLRRLGPASRESLTRVSVDASAPNGLRLDSDVTPLSFSADGRTVVFADRGPGPAGADAPQVVTLDLATGKRTQVTHLPRAPVDPASLDVDVVRFLPDGRIVFGTRANADGLNPQGESRGYTVRPDGNDLKPVPVPVVLAGSAIDPTFQITGDQATAIIYHQPDGSAEVFLLDRGNLLQLTNFHRPDTFRATVDVEGERVFFIASADPFGTNPSENCQIFSIERLGTDLRQLTEFSQGGHSALGCRQVGGLPPGCTIEPPRQDPMTRALVFPLSCDPFNRNPNGGQIFAMYPDGTGLQQLTDTSGVTTAADGTFVVELPGPFASTAVRR